MLYENYQQKIARIAEVLSKILRQLPKILIALAAVCAVWITLLVTKGFLGETKYNEQVIYGETIGCSADAFMSEVRFEYRQEGSEEWSTEAPILPGTYYLRATAEAAFGQLRYGEAFRFSILPRPIEIRVSDSEVLYGELPTVQADLAYSDYIVCDGVIYDDLTLENTSVTPDATKLQILDASGNDISSAYLPTVLKTPIAIAKRSIEVTVSDATQVYNGVRFAYDQYELSGGELVEGDQLQAVFDVSLTDVGSVINQPVLTVLNRDGQNMTVHYQIKQKIGQLSVTKRPLIVTSGGLSVTYDAQPHSNTNFEVNPSSGPIEGHTVICNSASSYTHAGIYQNTMILAVVDGQGKDRTKNYSIFVQKGTITIHPKKVTVTTYDYSWQYDGVNHSYQKLTVEGLISGHVSLGKNFAGIRNVGSMKNMCDFHVFTSSDHTVDVTKNYDITYTIGTLTVTKRPVTIQTGDATWVYDGIDHSCTDYTVISELGIVEGDFLSVLRYSSICDEGTAKNEFLYASVVGSGNSGNYELTVVPGTLTVVPRPIWVRTGSAEKIYDGTPLTCADSSISEYSPYSLIEGHTLTTYNTGSQTEIGEGENLCDPSKTRMNDGTRDVTANYTVEMYEHGILEVKPLAIIGIVTESDFKLYDGTPLTNPNYTMNITEGELAAEHKLIVDITGTITEIGEVENEATYRVLDSQNQDVTGMYWIDISFGILEIRESLNQDIDLNTIFGKIKTDRTGIIYLRQQSMGDFNGQTWNPAVNYSEMLPGGYSYNYLTSIALRNSGCNINVAEFTDSILYMLPYYIGFDGNYTRPTGDTAYSAKDSEYMLSYYTLPATMSGYEELKGRLGEYEKYELEYREFVYASYLNLDAETKAYMEKIIAEQSFDRSDADILHQVAHYIQNAASYNLNYDPHLDFEENVAIAFLETYKEGKCVHYATAATLLYRALGIPARYVEGFMIETQANEFVDIRNPGHAWVEVYIDGVGWVRMEVTGSEAAEKPNLTVIPSYQYKIKDGTPLVAESRIDADHVLSHLLENGYTYSVIVSGEQHEVGRGVSVIEQFILYDPEGKDVTDQYRIIREEGILEIFPQGTGVIRLYLYQLQKYYDGTPLRFEQGDYEILEIEDGLELKVSLNISLTEVGSLTVAQINESIDRYVTYTVYRNGKNVTSEYVLFFDVLESTSKTYVPIRIDKRSITIASASDSKLADGKPLTNNTVSITQGSLVSGHRLIAHTIASITEVGTTVNVIDMETVMIMDQDGNDVTSNYNITPIEGTLTVIDPEE